MVTKRRSTGAKAQRRATQPAAKRSVKTAPGRVRAGKKPASPPVMPILPRLRLRLTSIDDVKRELARLYREARAKRVDTQGASRLANMLSILGRLIEGSELEARIAAIEKLQKDEEWSKRR